MHGDDPQRQSIAPSAGVRRPKVARPAFKSCPRSAVLPGNKAGRAFQRHLSGDGDLAEHFDGGVVQDRHRLRIDDVAGIGARGHRMQRHAMTAQADAGDIVDAQAVPILGDDTAIEVFRKVSVAAELTLARALPALLAGKAGCADRI